MKTVLFSVLVRNLVAPDKGQLEIPAIRLTPVASSIGKVDGLAAASRAAAPPRWADGHMRARA